MLAILLRNGDELGLGDRIITRKQKSIAVT